MHDGNWTLVRGEIQQSSHVSRCAELSCGHAVLIPNISGETLAIGDQIRCPASCGAVDAGGAVDLSIFPPYLRVVSIGDTDALAHARAIGAVKEER